ncbi:hypothetical protein LJR071_002412 [Pseudomonas sp. LjRoot71]|uniref:hypothetical protein n=1 Tax=Pseudomonas sp. LjRoot71 TaxID=3342336 RepID=UPI003ECFF198
MFLAINKRKLASSLRILLITLVIFESSQLLSLYAGFSKELAGFSFSAFFSATFAGSIYLILTNKRHNENLAFYYPALIFFVVFIVSMISAAFLFPKPVTDWLPSLYAFLPIFSFYFLYLIKATAEDLAKALITTTILVTLLLCLDSLSRIELLDQYARLSIFDKYNRRIVLLKNEVILGIVILASVVISKNLRPSKTILCLATLLFCLFVQVKTMESRLGLVAFIISFITIFFFNRTNKKAAALLFLAGAMLLLLLPSWLLQNSEIIKSAVNLQDGGNIKIRIETVLFLKEIFYESYGLGVGMMSPTGNTNNILHSNQYINFYDGGVFATIAQFGALGIYIWYRVNFHGIKTLNNAAKITNAENRYIPIAIIAFILGLTISPLPLNLYLQPWSAFVGGIVIYFIWRLAKESNIKNYLN